MTTDKLWEDNFNPNDYDDLKSAEVERDRLRQENSTTNWIYVGADIRHPNEAKIGLTSSQLGTRASSSQNPRFTLLCAFKVKHDVPPTKLAEIENSVKTMLGNNYEVIPHYGSKRESEWFGVSPQEMREVVHDFLYENFNSNMDSYQCSERDAGVIKSWENTRLINGGDNLPYGPRDLSNPPIAFECLTPPGCGEDCDCW